jgi:hypothetical protein
MSKRRKLYDKIMSSKQDNNIGYEEVCSLLEYLEFSSRQKGTSHIVFSKREYDDIINLQNKNGKCKSYQVAQLRRFFRKEGIGYEDL